MIAPDDPHARPLPMTPHTRPLPASAHARPLPASALPVGPARIRAAGALNLLTWPALEASGANAVVTGREIFRMLVKTIARE